MNNINIIGRLVRDPELQTTQSGKSVGNLSIAVDRRFNKDETDFFDCTAWGKTAELAAEYLRKGSKVGISGSLRQDRFEVDGQKRSKVKINIEQLDFLDNKSTTENTNSGGSVKEEESDAFPF